MKCPFNGMQECDPDCAMLEKTIKHSNDGLVHGRACAFALTVCNANDVDIACRVIDTMFEPKEEACK